MLKTSAFQERQRAAIDTFSAKAIAAAWAHNSPATLLHAYQLVGTSVMDIQIGLASTVASDLRWRTLVIYPDALGSSPEQAVKRAAVLDREMKAAQLTRLAPARDGCEPPPFVAACAGQVREEVARWRALDETPGEGAPAPGAAAAPAKAPAPRPRFTPADFRLVIVNNPNERTPVNCDDLLPFFTGTRLFIFWKNAHPTTAHPPGSVKAGVVTYRTVNP